MSKIYITGKDLHRWQYGNGLTQGAAADCFGLPLARWLSLVRSDTPITDIRIINLYLTYTKYPQTVPIPPPFDFIGLFNELGITNDTKGKRAFAKLLGVSITAVYRILDKNAASRDIEAYAQALKRMNLSSKELLSLMRTIRMTSDDFAAAASNLETERTTQTDQKHT